MVKFDAVSFQRIGAGLREWMRNNILEVAKGCTANTILASKISDRENMLEKVAGEAGPQGAAEFHTKKEGE